MMDHMHIMVVFVSVTKVDAMKKLMLWLLARYFNAEVDDLVDSGMVIILDEVSHDDCNTSRLRLSVSQARVMRSYRSSEYKISFAGGYVEDNKDIRILF